MYDYFYGRQADQFSFYRVPKILFTEDKFWKYDLTQHPNYKYTSDFDKKNEFNIEQFLNRRLKLKAGDEYVVVDAD